MNGIYLWLKNVFNEVDSYDSGYDSDSENTLYENTGNNIIKKMYTIVKAMFNL